MCCTWTKRRSAICRPPWESALEWEALSPAIFRAEKLKPGWFRLARLACLCSAFLSRGTGWAFGRCAQIFVCWDFSAVFMRCRSTPSSSTVPCERKGAASLRRRICFPLLACFCAAGIYFALSTFAHLHPGQHFSGRGNHDTRGGIPRCFPAAQKTVARASACGVWALQGLTPAG